MSARKSVTGKQVGLKKYLLGFLVLLLVMGMATACGGNGNGASSGSVTDNSGSSVEETNAGGASGDTSEPVTITVGAEAGSPNTEFYKELVAEFTEKTGISVTFIDVPHDNMHDRFITEAMSGTGGIDVFVTDQPWVSEFASLGLLEPLSSRISEEDLEDFLPAAIETVSYEGEIYGLPFLVHTPIVYYLSPPGYN